MTEREHLPYHERRLEQQMLDALLRIEELLVKLLATKDPQVEFEQLVEAERADKAEKPKGKRR